MRYLDEVERRALHNRLRSSTTSNPLGTALLVLHSLSDLHPGAISPGRCEGCDQGCSCDAADWPCSSIELLIEHYKIDINRVVIEA